MNKIIKRINAKNIRDFYDIQSISLNGQISLKDKSVTIYKIDPANIVACDEATKNKIYQAYITCIRGLPDTFQIVILREKASFENQIKQYKKRLKEIENERLKFALQKYINYLEEISSLNNLYKTCHYLVVENLKKDEDAEIINIFSNLEEFGIKINKIDSYDKAKTILKEFIVKEYDNEY